MKRHALTTTLILFIVLPCVSVSGYENERFTELNKHTYAKIRQAILLNPSEAKWEQIPWQPDLGEAILEARKQDKPILLWMMNGHPCGMT